MALPTTISGVQFPAQNYYDGPFLSSGGNVYVVIPVDSGLGGLPGTSVQVFKATDPTSSFSQVGGDWTPSASGVASMWVAQVGDVLHVAARIGAVLYYRQFGMSSDAWAITGETVVSSLESNNQACSLAVRSDGQPVVLYSGATESVMGTSYSRTVYARRTGTNTWTTNVAVSATGVQNNYRGASAILGASDRVHFFYTDITNADLYHRSLSSGNVLDTGAAIDTSAVGSSVWAPAVGVRTGTSDLRLPYKDSSDRVSIAKATSGADPTFTFDTDVSDATTRNVNFYPVVCLTADSTDLYLLYADSSTNDLWLDKNTGSGWGTDTELLDAATINRVSCNVYTRSGSKVLAYVYDNGGTIKYDEFVISAGGTPSTWWQTAIINA